MLSPQRTGLGETRFFWGGGERIFFSLAGRKTVGFLNVYNISLYIFIIFYIYVFIYTEYYIHIHALIHVYK